MPDKAAEERLHAPPGLSSLVGETIGEGKRWARAELGYYKAVAGERAGDAGMAAGLAVGAAVLAQAALIAALVGIILALAPLVGPGLATLMVVVVTLGIAAILGYVALGRFRRIKAPLPGSEAS